MAMHSPSHPGRLIAADLDALGLSVADGARALGVTRSQLYRVIKGESAVSPEMALRLEAVLGSTADHWLRMQAAFDLAALRNDPENPAKSLKRLHAA
ncbi:HigA family addiction module antitoxin [Amorphus sp. 3PC139-8]|uniref:HigA family addiction module antitoxin n=1 Tax=Amorphus sp. 3PC139-8 TaxID=2735676 RepID=UPI00345CF8B6